MSTYERTLNGSTASNSIERFLPGHGVVFAGTTNPFELMQFCIDTVLIVVTIVVTDVLVDVKVIVDTDGNSREFFSWL